MDIGGGECLKMKMTDTNTSGETKEMFYRLLHEVIEGGQLECIFASKDLCRKALEYRKGDIILNAREEESGTFEDRLYKNIKLFVDVYCVGAEGIDFEDVLFICQDEIISIATKESGDINLQELFRTIALVRCFNEEGLKEWDSYDDEKCDSHD